VVRQAGDRLTRATLLSAVLLVAIGGGAAQSMAQQLYKYRDANGVWVFADRPPDAAQPFQQMTLERSREQAEVRLYRRTTEQGIVLIAQNTYFAPVQIAFELSRMDNLAEQTPRSGLQLLPPRSEVELMLLAKADPAAAMELEYRFQYLPGDPGAKHEPEHPYRLPYALSSSFRVSQSFPSSVTHNEPSSRYAIDFEMPVGTGVYAGRAGVVIEVASDYYDSGLDAASDGPRANIVRVLHDDGTMSLYAHLNWNSIRVVPGQRVMRGEYLADSGNTGFSTGPHLHFAVQRNRGGALVSVPVQFTGAGGTAVDVRTDERPVAYP
jgi:murein DD-endopeptidase MepM/ murein hydrolase activator NlpD